MSITAMSKISSQVALPIYSTSTSANPNRTTVVGDDDSHVNDFPGVCYLGTRWKGPTSIERLVIFGDSYSVFVESTSHEDEDEDEDDNTSAVLSNSEPTWVGHLTRTWRLNIGENFIGPASSDNFAVPGATVEDDLHSQVSRYLSLSAQTRNHEASDELESTETLYVLFIGINDVGCFPDEDDLEEIIENSVMDALHTLYVKAHARNFLIIDLPPMDRSPGALNTDSQSSVKDLVTAWNAHLSSRCSSFALSTPQATMLLFSAHTVISDILDDPEEYGFNDDDVMEEGGKIWSDELHLTGEVHEVLADRIVRALSGLEGKSVSRGGAEESQSTKRKRGEKELDPEENLSKKARYSVGPLLDPPL